jgi:hypothetical protein
VPRSATAASPARYYLLSYPAHAAHPGRHVAHATVAAVQLGAPETCNRRTLYKYFAPGLVDTCQLTMGLTMLAPGFCWVLEANPGAAAIWLSDTVPSRSVHLSELGLVRFDDTTGELVYEFVDPAFLRESYKLNAELPLSSTDYIALMDEQRIEGRLLRHILAEGIDEVAITTNGVPAGQARISVTIDGFSAAISLSPPFLEEPLQ